MSIKGSWWMYSWSRRYQQAAGIGDGALTERLRSYAGLESKRKEKGSLAINGERIGASVYWNERLNSRITNYVPTLLLVQSPSVRPSVRPYLSFSLHVYPSSGPCLSPLTAFLPHSEIPREQAMISNGGALRRRPCSFPFFSVRSSCSSSFCRGSNKDLRPRHPSSLPPTSSQGGAPPAILALRYYRPSSSFFSALPREAWSPLLIRYWSRDPRRLM